MGTTLNVEPTYVDIIIEIGLASNSIVFLLALLFIVFLLFELRKTKRAIVLINNLGYYSHSQDERIFRLRTALYRDTILVFVVLIQTVQCVAFAVLVSAERLVPLAVWKDELHIVLDCNSKLDSFPYVTTLNPITASVEGFFYSATCDLYLFLAILMSYFVKVYDDKTNPYLLSYRREYVIAIFAIIQFMCIWLSYSVYWVGRIAGFLAALCIVIDFLILLYFVCRLKCSIKEGASSSHGETRVRYIMLYREYMCICVVFMSSIVIYSFGLILAISTQWYLVLFDCRWLVGFLYRIQYSPTFSPETISNTVFHCLGIIYVITIIQFNIVLIVLTIIYAVSSIIRKCISKPQEDRPLLLEAETSIASSEYTRSLTESNNGSYTSNTTV